MCQVNVSDSVEVLSMRPAGLLIDKYNSTIRGGRAKCLKLSPKLPSIKELGRLKMFSGRKFRRTKDSMTRESTNDGLVRSLSRGSS